MMRKMGELALVVLSFCILWLIWHYVGFVHELAWSVNTSLAGWAPHDLISPLAYAFLGIEGFIAAWILALVLDHLPWNILFASMWAGMTLRFIVMTVGVLSPIPMAIWAYSILWGDVIFQGHVIWPADNPTTLYFGTGIMIGKWCAIYQLMQAMPFLVRAQNAVVWTVFDFISSLLPVFVVYSAILDYWLVGGYHMTPYRSGAMYVLGPSELIDIANLGVSLYLTARAILGFGEFGVSHGH